MVLYKDCPSEDLAIFTPQSVLAGNYILTALASPIDVTRTRVIKVRGEFIPIVYPTGSDYDCAMVQNAASTWKPAGKLTESEVTTGIKMYDEWKYTQAAEVMVAQEAEIASLRKALDNRENREGKMAAVILKEVRETDEYPRTATKYFSRKNLRRLLIVTLVLATVIFVLYGGYILGG